MDHRHGSLGRRGHEEAAREVAETAADSRHPHLTRRRQAGDEHVRHGETWMDEHGIDGHVRVSQASLKFDTEQGIGQLALGIAGPWQQAAGADGR